MARVTITPHQQTIQKGGTAKFEWSSDGCEDLYLLPGGPEHPGGIPLSGSTGTQEVQPEISTVYMVTCGPCNQEKTWDTTLVIVE